MIYEYGNYEICITQFNAPSVTTGQHTNGPANIFVRQEGKEWVVALEKSLHKVKIAIDRGDYD